jgi:hypothetical protein
MRTVALSGKATAIVPAAHQTDTPTTNALTGERKAAIEREYRTLR